MKHFLIIFCVLFAACSREIIITEEDIKEDLLYVANDIKPFSGTCKILYSDTSMLKELFEFVNGVMDGRCTSYYEDGSIKWEGSYKKGKSFGKWEYWDNNGSKYCEAHFDNDLYDGPYMSWHANGQLKEAGQFTENIKTGKWTVYDDRGNVVDVSVY
jgi:antitoxin component YwqK of YwqJK toxin-antitoxin module